MSQRGAVSSLLECPGRVQGKQRGLWRSQGLILMVLFLGMESEESQRDLKHRQFPDVLFVFMAFNHS